MKMVTTAMGTPPQPILPKANKKLKLLDIDPIEMARQLTLMESELYQRIRPMECLQRAREGKTDNVDNITVVIQTSNKVSTNYAAYQGGKKLTCCRLLSGLPSSC